MNSLILALALAVPLHAQEADTPDAPAPADEAPADQAPTEDAPAEEDPAEDAAEGEAAPEAAPVEAAPVEAAEDVPSEEPVATVETPAEQVEETKAEPWEKEGWGWGGFPFAIYNSDEGVGAGIIGSVYKYNGESSPYKARFGGQIYFTTKGVQYHKIDTDVLDMAGGKLRLNTRVLFDSRFTATYCGMGGDVNCSDELAERQIEFYDIPEDEREEALAHWYQSAYRMPYGLASIRYLLDEMPHKVEFIGSYRLSYLAPFEKYEHTYYQYMVDPDEDRGFTSVLQAGLMVDNRDNEPAPKKGYWVEGTVRGAHQYIGSQWDWFGFNTTLRGYLPILPEGRLTLADRTVFDGIVGDANYREMDWVGGYQMWTAAGGARSLRGIRAERYRGKVKILNQAELRWKAVTWRPGKTTVDFYFQGFVDAAHVAAEWEDLGGSPIHLGEGGGLRIAINQNFILRGDFATSFDEGWGLTGVYLDVDNLW